MNRSVHSGVIPELLHSQGVAAEHWLAHVPGTSACCPDH